MIRVVAHFANGNFLLGFVKPVQQGSSMHSQTFTIFACENQVACGEADDGQAHQLGQHHIESRRLVA